MEGSLNLVGYKFSPTTQFVKYVALQANAPVQVENVTWNQEERRKELKSHTPTGTFPYLSTSHGNLSESNAINYYLCEAYAPALLGSNGYERASVRQWVEFANLEVYKAAPQVTYPIFGWTQYNKEQSDAAIKTLKENLLVLNKHLEGKTYVVGSNLTLADLTLFYNLRPYFQFVFVDDLRKKLFPNITIWFMNLATQEQAVTAFGRTLLCKVPLKTPKVEKKEEPKKKEEKPKAEPKKEAAVEGGDDDEEKPKKKKGDPLDELPPSSFVLDNFKKDFLNTTDKQGALQRFWNDYDPNGYSIWWMQYQKLPSEGKILFKSCNSSSFFLQKLDPFRKFCFAAHGVYGVEGNYEIRGVWMWRGTDIPNQVREHDNFPYMTIKRLDPTKEEDKKLIEAYWTTLEPGVIVDGMPVAEAVTFK